VRESHLRRDVADLHRTVYLKLETIQNLEQQLKQAKEEITRLDNIRIELNGVIKTNKEENPESDQIFGEAGKRDRSQQSADRRLQGRRRKSQREHQTPE